MCILLSASCALRYTGVLSTTGEIVSLPPNPHSIFRDTAKVWGNLCPSSTKTSLQKLLKDFFTEVEAWFWWPWDRILEITEDLLAWAILPQSFSGLYLKQHPTLSHMGAAIHPEIVICCWQPKILHNKQDSLKFLKKNPRICTGFIQLQSQAQWNSFWFTATGNRTRRKHLYSKPLRPLSAANRAIQEQNRDKSCSCCGSQYKQILLHSMTSPHQVQM